MSLRGSWRRAQKVSSSRIERPLGKTAPTCAAGRQCATGGGLERLLKQHLAPSWLLRKAVVGERGAVLVPIEANEERSAAVDLLKESHTALQFDKLVEVVLV